MKKPTLSIVIPVYNEEGNVKLLLERISMAMKSAGIKYEVVFIDDHSTDKTVEIIKSLSTSYPLSLLKKKKGMARGKASSLLAGFAFAKADVITMIDADLQYPPEAIIPMFEKILHGAGVVIANRKKRKTGFIRQAASLSYRYVFGNILLGFKHDVQSGLKVFRKEIIERVAIAPSQWMFDLEFLVFARDAGYIIESHDIEFAPRHTGAAKINVVTAAVEMALAAVQLRVRKDNIIPFHAETKEKHGNGFHFKGLPFVSYSGLKHYETAFFRLSIRQTLWIIGFLLILAGALMISWHATLVGLVALLTVLYFVDMVFNFSLVLRSVSKDRELMIDDEDTKIAPVGGWPKYTIFCPLYKEWQVIPQFVRAMSQLDYPKDKLQVMLLLEEDDTASVEKVAEMELPSYFTVKVIPHNKPKTKPKALNFGLRYATGEYSVIYDAEDIPDPLQLKKAVLAFKRSPSTVKCIQAKLNFYNPRQNLLTRMFTTEYSLWFDLVLPGLQSIEAPIPLGGTSNHFRVSDLHILGGWDAFNVTEDCDLGIRLAKRGYHTAIVNSTTMEEANSSLLNWYGQRSRWIKGYIQTYMVHMRDLSQFSFSRDNPNGFTFQMVVGGKILSLFINPFMWLITISYFSFRATLGPIIETFYPLPVLYMGVFSLVFGNFLYMYSYMIGCFRREEYGLVKFALITPLYWLAMSAAAWKAVWEIVFNPHYWHKTTHGLHLAKQPEAAGAHRFGIVQKVKKHLAARRQKARHSQILPPYRNIVHPNVS